MFQVSCYLRYTLFPHTCASMTFENSFLKKEKTWILTFFRYKNLATVLMFYIPLSFVSMHLTTKWSGLIKGVTSHVQTLLVCYWSLSQQCHQNLFLTDSSTFAQNVVHALITPRLDYCRSFMVILNLSLLNFEMTSSYSGEQSEHLPLPSFSWLSSYCSTQVEIALWFTLFLLLITEVSPYVFAHFTVTIMQCSSFISPPYICIKKKNKLVWCVWIPSIHLPALHKNCLFHSWPCR